MSGESLSGSRGPASVEVTSNSTKALLFAGGIVVGAAVGYALAAVLLGKRKQRLNTLYKLDLKKVVDTVDIEEIGEKKVYCRCWKSKTFPFCDGAHGKYNRSCGDNLGPLVIKGKAPEQAAE